MKISKLFHWLYFTVMMLPIFILPIFALAVRSDNNYQPIEITIGEAETTTLNFNQLVLDGKPNDLSHASTGDGDLTISDSSYYCYYTEEWDLDFYLDIGGKGFNQHQYLLTFEYKKANNNYGNNDLWVNIHDDDELFLIETDFLKPSLSYKKYSNIFYINNNNINSSGVDLWCSVNGYTSGNSGFYIKNIMLVDLTAMYGSGNEVSTFTFFEEFNQSYYDFTLDTTVVIGGDVTPVVYNDFDVGSQMVYTMYHGVDKYFNYDSVFNFGDLYSWLNINFFNGAAPLGFFIFWHLLIYWLLTSLIWLLFDVLIYVPMLIHRWLDKASLS